MGLHLWNYTGDCQHFYRLARIRPAVIMPLTTQHYPLLQRNLLYTAITRAKKVAVLIGSPKALEIALTNDKPHQRQTGLAQFLQSNIAASK